MQGIRETAAHITRLYLWWRHTDWWITKLLYKL